jgi:hypothetical protein
MDVPSCAAAAGVTSTAGSGRLPPGVHQCSVEGVVRANMTVLFSFTVDNTTDVEPYTLVIMLRSVNGNPYL